MTQFEEKLRKFAEDLFRVGAIKFGDYIIKLGVQTPIYIDLRLIVSYPKLIDFVSDLLVEYIKQLPKFDIICGVPYAALPLASALSVKLNVPMVMRRKEAKGYGLKKMIEGVYNKGDRCLIIEDVVTSGSSILETVKDLNNVGINCAHTVVLVDREQGGIINLQQEGIEMCSLLNMTNLLKYLREAGEIDDALVEKVTNYMRTTQVTLTEIKKQCLINRLQMSYEERISYCKNNVAAKLFKIMSEKKTNLCIAADVIKSSELIDLADRVGPHICLFKTHIDILEDFDLKVIQTLKNLAKKHKFLLLEDRKFADIGKTVQLQYNKGVYQISSWAELVTAHSVTGNGLLEAIKRSDNNEKGVFLLAETSAAGSLINGAYTQNTIKLAKEYNDIVAGIVCQNPLFIEHPGLIQLTPGVQLEAGSDKLGQQYNSVEVVMQERGADIAVVGRGITLSTDPAATASKYQSLLWDAYLKRIN
ncbi:hypothetical protein FQR65_LT08632 [Abscondita terminalis]|nr:hypothetical protein FQR65_LT08632 [Abscondita terminalis]